MKVEYFDDTHQYVVDGVIVPSVSTLVAYATGQIYKDIPEEILEKARVYGTAVHDAIELYETDGTENEEYLYELNSYKELKAKYMLNVKSMEQIVNYEQHYGGRYDLLDIDGNLWDIKTTSRFHKENLEWQLGLYYLALGKESEVGYCIHIPRVKYGKPKVHLVKPKTNAECIALIETYEQKNKGNEYITEDETNSME